MSTSSCAFAINGGAVGVKASVSAAGAVVATISSLAGIRSVIWSIASTDESSTPGSYTLVASGLYGSTVSTTALAAGTAAILLCTASDGTNVFTASAKFFVPTSGGLEVQAADEKNQSNATSGTTGIVNAAVRAAGSGSAYPFTSTAPPAIAVAGSAGANATELARRDHTHAHGAQTSGTLHAAAVASVPSGSAGTSGFLTAPDQAKLNRILLDVNAYGTTDPTGVVDSYAAIAAAIAAAKASSVPCTIGGLRGTYLLSAQLHVDFDNFELDGGGSTLTTNVDAAHGFTPILVQGAVTNNDVAITRNVSIHDLTIRHLQAGPNSAGAIQLNAVYGGTIARVTIKGDGAGCASSKCDGIACAFGTRDIQIANCVTDGISKGGFYLAGCEHITLVGCVAKNGYESINPFTSGLNIGNARNCAIIGSHFYSNRGYGVCLDTAVGQFTASISTLTNQTHFRFTCASSIGSYAASGIAIFDTTLKRFEELQVLSATPVGGTSNQQYDIVLSAAPAFTLTGGATIQIDYWTAKHIAFEGCSFVDNVAASGGGGVSFQVQSELVAGVAQDVVLTSCVATGSVYGFAADQVRGLRLVGCSATGNGLNVYFQDVGAGVLYVDGTGAENLCNDITIIGGAYYDSTGGNENIRLAGANDVTIDGARIYHTAVPFGTETGIKLFTKSVVTANKPCANLRILDPKFSGYSAPGLWIALNTAGAAPTSGAPGDAFSSSYFRVDGQGNPTTYSIPAPPGSEWTDTTHARAAKFIKISADDSTKWGRVHTDLDDNTIPTQTLQVRSPSGGIFYAVQSGGTHLFGDVPGNSFLAVSNTAITVAVAQMLFTEGIAPTWIHNQRTTDAAVHDWSLTTQTPYASATGTNRNSGGFSFTIPAPVSGGTAGSLTVTINGSQVFKVSDAKLGFYTATPIVKPTVTGSRGGNAAVASALTALASLGLIIDSST